MEPLELIEFNETKYIYEDVCRICLRKNVILNWNDELPKDFGVTYKECYYKFTQLDLLVNDPYSQMLCQNCARDLRKSHILVKKALESHAIIQQRDFQRICYENDDVKEESYGRGENIDYIETLEIIQEKGISEASNKATWKANNNIEENEETSENTFSTSFTVEQISNQSVIKSENTKNDFSHDGELIAKSPNKKIYNNGKIIKTPQVKANKQASQNDTSENTFLTSFTVEQISNQSVINSENIINDYSDDGKSGVKSPNKIYNNGKIIETPQVKANKQASQKNNGANKLLVEMSTSKQKKRKKNFMCSTCSLFCESKAKLTMHEKTHNKNRERSVTCAECGLRTFTKQHLKLHLETHKEGREKKYKCEFCTKAYFNMGALNVHRRIHLGQMVPCPICSKEFYRQVDLDRHFSVAHSEAPLSTDVKKQSNYYVYCKICNKEVRTPRWKAHQAAHLNEPVVSCSICNKEFYARSALIRHLQRKHKYKTKDEYGQFVVYLKTNRLSHLLLEQQDMLKKSTN